MRVCIVSSGDFYSNYGGGQVYVRNLVDELIRQKGSLQLELYVLSISPTFAAQSQTKEYKGVSVYEINPCGDIKTLLSEIRPDIVHAHGEKHLITTICKIQNIPCVITAHHGGICCPAGALLNCKDEICHEPATLNRCLPCYLRNIRTGKYWYPIVKHIPTKQYIKIGKWLKHKPFIPFISPIGEALYSIQEKIGQWNAIHANTTMVIAPSNAIADTMILNGCPKDKITVIPHGIPIPLNVNPSPLTTHHSSLIHFYYVGRICYVKGIHIMLQAFSEIDNSNIRLHIIGGTGNKTEDHYRQKLVQKYKNDTRIIWHGKLSQDRMSELVKEYHCLIHPTICMEIFGLDIAEAISQHKYVIATQCGGAEMQIHNKNEGILIAPNNANQLKNAVLQFLEKPATSTGISISMEKHVTALMKIYQYGCELCNS